MTFVSAAIAASLRASARQALDAAEEQLGGKARGTIDLRRGGLGPPHAHPRGGAAPDQPHAPLEGGAALRRARERQVPLAARARRGAGTQVLLELGGAQ